MSRALEWPGKQRGRDGPPQQSQPIPFRRVCQHPHAGPGTLDGVSRPPECALIDAARSVSRRSVRELAEATGYNVRTIQEALSGRRKRPSGARDVNPSLGVLIALARILEVTPDQLRRAGRNDAATALDLLGAEFDFSRVPTAALVDELARRTGGPETGTWHWTPANGTNV